MWYSTMKALFCLAVLMQYSTYAKQQCRPGFMDIIEDEVCPCGTYRTDTACYYLSTYETNVMEAQTICESMGFQLLSVTSEEENDVVRYITTNTFYTKVFPMYAELGKLRADVQIYVTRFLTGGMKQGDGWVWMSGEEFSYDGWEPGQPSATKSMEVYMAKVNEYNAKMKHMMQQQQQAQGGRRGRRSPGRGGRGRGRNKKAQQKQTPKEYKDQFLMYTVTNSTIFGWHSMPMETMEGLFLCKKSLAAPEYEYEYEE